MRLEQSRAHQPQLATKGPPAGGLFVWVNDTHLLSTVHCVDEEIIEWLGGARSAGRAMSASPPKADIRRPVLNVRFVPIGDIRSFAKNNLLSRSSGDRFSAKFSSLVAPRAPSVCRSHIALKTGCRPSFSFFSGCTVRRSATSVEERVKKPRRNATLTLRACRYRGPCRQPSRLCCSSCRNNGQSDRSSSNASGRNSCRPYRGSSGGGSGRSYEDLCMQVRTYLRARTRS
jgi:hypothetical protein